MINGSLLVSSNRYLNQSLKNSPSPKKCQINAVIMTKIRTLMSLGMRSLLSSSSYIRRWAARVLRGTLPQPGHGTYQFKTGCSQLGQWCSSIGIKTVHGLTNSQTNCGFEARILVSLFPYFVYSFLNCGFLFLRKQRDGRFFFLGPEG